MIRAKIYRLHPGSYSVSDSDLFESTILIVKRNGIGFDSSGGNTPGTREFEHIADTITFADAGADLFDPASTVDKTEMIYCLFKG